MIDFGFDKLALIGAVALIVIGPERLPRVARTVGHLLGKAQRYVADVKAEVNRSIELEELKKMKTHVEESARDMEQTVHKEFSEANQAFEQNWAEATSGLDGSGGSAYDDGLQTLRTPGYQAPKKNWRLKRGATPQWYKQREGVRRHVQSGAARVARFRPPRRPSP
ncbi:Sec-independent protein translocase subunit TatB [Roseateles sp. DAIF2]|uniref:Sec-independent protein translocase protein TatB n=1 Tax=Roseateles sp. DAIF2 TaxID=2714952 RepID=UPI0018A25F0E|nr:Sec-independent protein translocase protein TatB [Roseateles sp. DAIF2]QPF75232.1 Sec-independent protein translocase subunit TatB [Roseateles sp. DAIF2]